MKDFKPIIILTAIVAGLAIIGFWGYQNFNVNLQPPKYFEVEKEPVPQSTIELKAQLAEDRFGEGMVVNLIASPSDPTVLSAFAIKTVISPVEGTFSVINNSVSINQNLTNAGWSFPINKILSNQNQLSLEFSGYHIGSKRYQLEKETILATVSLEEPYPEEVQIVSINDDVTRFYGSDAITEIPYYSDTVTEINE